MKIQLGIYDFTPLCTNSNGQACQISVIGFPFYCKLGIFEASPILHTCRPAVYSIKPSAQLSKLMRIPKRILYRFLCLIEGRF